MKKIILAILVLVLLVAFPVAARTSYYYSGDSVFTIKAGVDFPAFINFYNSSRGTYTFWDTHLSLGGYASIAYQGYLNEYWALGGELAYAFNFSHSELLLTTVPITARLTFVPVQTGTFDLAASLNLGVAFLRYNEGKYLAPYASLTVQPTVYFTENWGLGVESGLMLTAEIYGQNDSKHKASALGGLLPVTLAISYRR